MSGDRERALLRMKVLLVNSGADLIALSCEPIGLEYLAAYMEQHGVEVRIINMAQRDVIVEAIKWQPDLVGFTASTPSINLAYRDSDRLRRMGFKTVIGGIHASIMPEEAIQHADWVVVGDGEEALMNIVGSLHNIEYNKTHKENEIGLRATFILPPGILRPEYIKDISKLPFPARHLVDTNYFFEVIGYRWPFGEKKKWVPITTARGCLYKCRFCTNSKRPNPPRYNSVDRVIEEIQHIQKTYGISNLFFMDDDLFLPAKRFKELAERMIPLNVRWMSCLRATSATDEILELAVRSGCRYVSIGFETNSQACLNALDKQSSPEANQRAADLCAKHGIKVLANIMVGIPGETPADLEETIAFIKRNKFYSTGLTMATPMPGTKLWDYAKEHNLIPDGLNWNDFIIGNARLNVSANVAMTREETMKYFNIIDQLIEISKARLDPWWMIRLFLKNPKNALRTAWGYRKRIAKYIGRIK
jgi:anaerobic magnesium-protoporphyrin IX monomethyl ester cyclase